MPEMTAVGNTIIPPDPMRGISTLSGILGIQRQRQELQTGAAQLQTAQAFALQNQQKAKETQAGAQLLADPVGNGLIDSDGNPTKDAYQRVKAAMPTTGDEHYTNIVNAAKNRVELQNASAQLTAGINSTISGRIQGVAVNPDANTQDLRGELDRITNDYAGTPAANQVARLVAAYKHGLDTVDPEHGPEGAKRYAFGNASALAPKTPLSDAQRSFATGASRGAMTNEQLSGPAGLATPRPATVDTGEAVHPGAVAPITGAFTPSGTPITKGLPPQAGVEVDFNGKKWYFDQQKNLLTPLGGGKAIPAPPGFVPKTSAPGGFEQPKYRGQAEDIDVAQKHVASIRNAADQVGMNRNINDTILRLSQNTNTGPGTQAWHSALGALSLGTFGDDYQEMGKFLEKNAIANMQAMGGSPSDARLGAAVAANGGPQFNAGALQAVTKFNDATNTALGKYRYGLEAARDAEGGYNNVAKFRADWAKNFDVDVFRTEDAMRRGDNAELMKIKQERGKDFADLNRKRINLESLANTGKLPNAGPGS